MSHKYEIFTTKGQVSKIPNLLKGVFFLLEYVCVCENCQTTRKILGI